jgi:ribonuclease P/MRP protein subunit RPP20
MGAAIPHLVQLSVALPPILPFPSQDVHTEVFTGTVDVQDELIPADDDEDISYQTRSKSTLRVEIRVGDKEVHSSSQVDGASGKSKKGKGRHKAKKASGQAEQIVFEEPEQPDPDTT